MGYDFKNLNSLKSKPTDAHAAGVDPLLMVFAILMSICRVTLSDFSNCLEDSR